MSIQGSRRAMNRLKFMKRSFLGTSSLRGRLTAKSLKSQHRQPVSEINVPSTRRRRRKHELRGLSRWPGSHGRHGASPFRSRAAADRDDALQDHLDQPVPERSQPECDREGILDNLAAASALETPRCRKEKKFRPASAFTSFRLSPLAAWAEATSAWLADAPFDVGAEGVGVDVGTEVICKAGLVIEDDLLGERLEHIVAQAVLP